MRAFIVPGMGRVALSLSLIAWAACGAFGQAGATGPELVPNGSFEVVRKPPRTFDQLGEAEGWKSVTLGYAEVFDRGAPAKTVGIPENAYGTMEPADGDRYAGFVAWKDDQRRDHASGPEDPFKPGWSAYSEYLMVELNAPLEEGLTYELSFQVALAQHSDRTLSGLGAYCSEVPLRYEHRRFLQERPQVGLEQAIEERGVWRPFAQRFVADGGERYLIIGIFPLLGDDRKRIIEGADNQYAYYFIDAVGLKSVPQP